jgi:uncharacterized protein (TIGR03067 family)
MNAHVLPECERLREGGFFDSEAGLADQVVISHLDSCADCRAFLDSEAGDRNHWEKLKTHLQPTEFDSAGADAFSAASIVGFKGQQSFAIQDVLDSLSPTDDPHKLGRLGSYEITGVIGVGGMGIVLKAVDPSLDRVVAVKVMAPSLANNDKARKRFSREAKAAAAVLHPNVIPIHSVASDGAIPYLVMAYVRGGSLQKRIEHEGPLPIEEILRIGSQISAGLAAAHEQGLVHRDIKPENVLLEEGVERVTITDFGLARAVDDNTVTQNGTIAGTPMFMSPEQARGEKVEHASDLFSLGSVIYALCTGRPPYTGESSYSVMRKIIDESPSPIQDANPDIPDWLVGIVQQLMAKDKSKRFSSAADVHRLLDACLSHVQQPESIALPEEVQRLGSAADDEAAQKRAESRPQRSRGPWLAGLACIACIAAFLLFQNSEHQQRDREMQDAHADMRGYLRSGNPERLNMASLHTLLSHPDGYDRLRSLDEDFPEFEFIAGGLPQGLKAAAILLHHGAESGQRKLSLTAVRDEYKTGPVILLPHQIRVDGLELRSGSVYDKQLEIRYSASTEAQHRQTLTNTLQLKPGAEYKTAVAVADIIQDRVDWINIWKAGQPTGVVSRSVRTSRRSLRPDPETAVLAIRGIMLGLEARKVIEGSYPTMDEGLEVIARERGSSERVDFFLFDPWGHQYGYQVPGRHGSKPDVWSVGPDGKTGTDDDICSWNLPEESPADQRARELTLLVRRWTGDSENADELAEQLDSILAGLRSARPDTERARQQSIERAELFLPHLLKPIPASLAALFADRTAPGKAVRLNDTVAAAGRPTEACGWAVQAVHALALARSGRIDEALAENERLWNKIDTNIRKGRLPLMELEFLGEQMSQHSVLQQITLHKGLILAIAGETEKAAQARRSAGASIRKSPSASVQAVLAALDAEMESAKALTNTDGDRIQGTWKVVFVEDSGRTGLQGAISNLRFVFAGDRMTTEIAGRKSESFFTLDPSTTPKSIHLSEGGRTKPGIYDLQGDTLRICISEFTDEQPTAFDSQPDSPNDLILTMKRVTKNAEPGAITDDTTHNGPLTPELASKLIPRAASISNEDFQTLQTQLTVEAIDNKSLSLILMALDVSEELPHLDNDFRFLMTGVPKPSELAAAMSLSKAEGYVSMIQPTYISDCRIWHSTERRAKGYVAFNAPLLYSGNAIFEAEKSRGEWRITKFRLQNRRISVVLGDDGKWQRETRPEVKGASIGFEIPDGVATGVRFSGDSRKLATTSESGVRIWSTDGKLLKTLQTAGTARSPAFDPIGDLVFAAESRPDPEHPSQLLSTVHGWHLQHGWKTTPGSCRGIVRDLVVSPDGQRVAAISFDDARNDTSTIDGRKPRNWGYLTIWNIEAAERIASVDFKQLEKDLHGWEQSDDFYEDAGLRDPEHLRFSIDGTRLAVAFHAQPFRSARVVVVDGRTGKFEVLRRGGGITEFDDDGNIVCASFTTKGNLVLEQRAALRWRAKAGDFALTLLNSGQVSVQALKSPRYHQLLPQPDTPFPLLDISVNGRFVVIGEDAGVTVWKLDDRGQLLSEQARSAQQQAELLCEIETDQPDALAFSPDGQLLAETRRSRLQVWSVPQKKIVQQFYSAGRLHAPVFTPDGSSIVVADGIGNLEYQTTLRMWNLSTRGETKLGQCMGLVKDIQFNADGSRYAAVTWYGPIAAVTSTADSKFLGGNIIVWDRQNLENPLILPFEFPTPEAGPEQLSELLMWEVSRSVPRYLALDEIGSRLVSVTESGVLQAWDLNQGQLMFKARGWGRPQIFNEMGPFPNGFECGGLIYDESGNTLADNTPMKWHDIQQQYGLHLDVSGAIELHDFAKPPTERSISIPGTGLGEVVALTAAGPSVAVGDANGIKIWTIAEEPPQAEDDSQRSAETSDSANSDAGESEIQRVNEPAPDTALFDVTVNGKQGFINKDGVLVIEPRFQRVYPFSDGLAAAQIGNQWGFIDKTGRFVIEPQFIEVAPFSCQRARVRLKEYTDPWGYIDTTGQIVIEPEYDAAAEFQNGIARVGMATRLDKLKGYLIDAGVKTDERYIDVNGNPAAKPRPEHYGMGTPNELIPFTQDGKVGYVDVDGKVVIRPQFEAGARFSDGLALARGSGPFGYIDRSGRYVIQPQFQYANDFADGLAGVPLEGGKWGFIDRHGKTVLPARYDWIYGGFRHGIAKVTVAGRIGYIDTQGEWVW